MTPSSRRSPSPPPPLPPIPGSDWVDWFNLNWVPITKIALFILGLSIGVNEFFFQAKPEALAIGAMMALFGLPFTFGRNGNGIAK